MGETPDAARRGVRDRGVMTTIDHTPVAAGLRARGFVGRLVEPTDPDYDTARAGWNGAIDRRPAAVAYARMPTTWPPRSAPPGRTACPFTVRAGGHSVSGRSIRDGALCIDLRALNASRSTPRARSSGSAAEPCSASSTPRRRSTASPSRQARSRTPASAG